jgi:transposase InsO family protein
MDERVKFIAEYLKEESTISDLCRAYGISRPTAYKWIERYEEEGPVGLEDRSRAPHHHPNAVPAKQEAQIVAFREKHRSWGPGKLLANIRPEHPEWDTWPAASTVGEIVKRHGLVVPRRRRDKAKPTPGPLTPYEEVNNVWCADFKGWFRTGDGTRCDPLTISDGHSRYFLRCQVMVGPRLEAVQALFEATFREYGLPRVIRTDNGAPFASTGLGGLTRLSVWWIRLGVEPERIRPGNPQENGRHERLHRTLKEEAITPPRATPRAQQRAFDRFREEYNHVRPHEALGQRPPGEIYEPSPRPFPARILEIEYPSDMVLRKVKSQGDIAWKGGRAFLSETLAGQIVGLRQIDEDSWSIHFARLELAELDARKLRIRPVGKPRGGGGRQRRRR